MSKARELAKQIRLVGAERAKFERSSKKPIDKIKAQYGKLAKQIERANNKRNTQIDRYDKRLAKYRQRLSDLITPSGDHADPLPF
jgi:hypothetical protein